MQLNNAPDIRIGDKSVKAVYLGEELIWPVLPPKPEPEPVPEPTPEPIPEPEPEIPPEFTRLLAILGEYDGGTSIMLDYIPKSNTKIVMDCKVTTDSYKRSPYACLFGYSGTTGELSWSARQQKWPGSDGAYGFAFEVGPVTSSYFTEPNWVFLDGDIRFDERFTLTAYGNKLIISYENGEGFTLTNEHYSLADMQCPICIFGTAYYWGSANMKYNQMPSGPTMLYSAKIYEGNELIYSFYPVIRNSDKTCGLWETVHGVFHVNTGQYPAYYKFAPIYMEDE